MSALSYIVLANYLLLLFYNLPASLYTCRCITCTETEITFKQCSDIVFEHCLI